MVGIFNFVLYVYIAKENGIYVGEESAELNSNTKLVFGTRASKRYGVL